MTLVADYTYLSLVKGILFLAFVYAVYWFLKVFLLESGRLKRWRKPANKAFTAVEYLLLPFGVTILSVIFILVNPYQNGLIVLLTLIVGFNSIRNFYSRFLLRSQNTFNVGDRLMFEDFKGVILKLNTFNVVLQSENGLHFVPYADLARKPYTVLDSQEVQHSINATVSYEGESSMKPVDILDILFLSQYLDLKRKPEVEPLEDNEFDVKILLQKGVTSSDLADLLAEHKLRIKK